MYHFIMNPKASSGKGIKVWKQIETILQKEQVAYQKHILKSAKETTEFVRHLTDINGCGMSANVETDNKTCHIVVLGGDGTINAVLNGIVDFEHTILSCIRTGSGNDFARNVGVEKRAEKAMKHLLYDYNEQCLDYGVVSYETEEGLLKHRFIISSGIGYDADICEEAGRSILKKRLNRIGMGKLVYLAIGVKQIFTRVNTGATIRLDQEIRIEVPKLFFVVGMIHEKEGGGVPFCPNADASDGLLDICLVRDMPKWKLLLAVIMVYAKQHYRFRAITAHRSKKMCVELEEPQWFHMDGETSVKIRKIELECQSGVRFRM